MASYNDTVLTNNGIAILNRVLAGKCTINFTRAVSSIADYSGKTLSELQSLTSLASIEQNGVATRFDVRSETMVSIDLLFTNKDLQNSYEIKTIGLYAQASDSSTEVLYAIATASDPETMPAYVDQKLAKFTLTLYTKVGQADKTSITITDEGVVKSINGSLTPDVNGDVTVDDSSHAKFIEAELINGHLLVPLVDDSGNPITDPAGNQLIADEYLPKSVMLGDHRAIYPGADNTIRLPVYTQAEVDAMLSTKADTTSVTTKEDVDAQTGLIYGMLAQNRLVTPLAGDDGMTMLDESGNALMSETRAVTSINGKTPGTDGNIAIDDYYSKQAIDNRLEVKADLLQMEDEHNALQGQITDNTDHLGTLDDTIDQHAKQISQATGEASYALDQISTGQSVTALSDGQGGYLTDENGNTLLTPSAWVNAIKLGGRTYTPDSAGNVTLDTYSMQEISNMIDSLKLAAKAYTDTAKSDLTAAMNNFYQKADIDSMLSAKLDASKAGTPTVITSPVDLNALTTCGSYFIQNSLGTTSNTPIPNSWLCVRVEGVPTRITQTVWKDIDPTIQWVRFYNGTWGNWTQITKAI